MSPLGARRPEEYFDTIRWDLLRFVKPGKNVILELGCGSGKTGEALKKEAKAEAVVGIELIPEIADKARGSLDQVIVGDIEILVRELSFAPETFDYLIAGDVLEHLKDPWCVLAMLRRFLKLGGHVIASIPNIRHWRILRDLIFQGEWQYGDADILDKTHLRFFTKKSIVQMFKSCGYEVLRIEPGWVGQKSRFMNWFTLGLFEEFLAWKYICIARRSS